jgi:hypothetical protein
MGRPDELVAARVNAGAPSTLSGITGKVMVCPDGVERGRECRGQRRRECSGWCQRRRIGGVDIGNRVDDAVCLGRPVTDRIARHERRGVGRTVFAGRGNLEKRIFGRFG